MDLTVVIPVYNEEESINLLYGRVREALQALGLDYEVIAVDDGSSDGSFALLRDVVVADPRWTVIRFRRNFGQSAAFAAGFDRAAGEVVVTMDADLQNDPADIPLLLEEIDKGADIVCGWRKDRQDPLLLRRVPSVVANWLIGRFTGVQLHDRGCSLKAYRREVVKEVRLYGELHRFIPSLASWMGVEVAEVVVRHEPRRRGKSKYGIGRTMTVILDMLTVSFLLNYATRPIQIFGGLGLVCLASGGVLGAYLTYVKLALGQNIGHRPLLSLVLLLLLGGVQFISMGLMGELLVRTYFEAQGKAVYVVREVVEGKTARGT